MIRIKLKIRLYGENLSLCLFDDEKAVKLGGACLLHKIMDDKNRLIDPFFYHSISCSAVNDINTISIPVFSGLIANHKGILEIWKGRKLNERWKLQDIINYPTLFPVLSFSIDEHFERASSIEVNQTEIGNTANFLISDAHFDANLLLLKFKLYKGILVLSEIFYKESLLKCQKGDTLIINQSVQKVV